MTPTDTTWQQLCNQLPTANTPSLAESALNIAVLNHLGVLRISGEDAASFLQSQLTNDVSLLTTELGQINGYCNHKGRLLALFQLQVSESGFTAIIPQEMMASLSKRLQMFVMRSAVSLEEQTETDSVASLWGAQTTPWLEHNGYRIAEQPYSCQQSTDHPAVTVIRQPGNDTFLLLGPKQPLAALLLTQANLAPVFRHENEWRIETINNGQPTVVSATCDAFIPQMINLDLINGVSFQKGCYPGQEIVARTRYLGKLKKRMMLFETESNSGEQMPRPGDPVMTPGNEQSVGTVVDAAASTSDQSRLLAVIRIDAINKPLSVIGQPLSALNLPYEIDTDIGAS